ncbi:serine--tRNA ligase [Candidatus Dojkabacteria bacterium]|nr:serine--tRNA ligase [Candidatus Dojkabacteria bacterium]
MLDIKYIRENPEKVKEAAANKQLAIDIDHLLEVDKKFSVLNTEVEELRARRNDNAEKMKAAGGKPDDEAIEQGKRIKIELQGKESELGKLENELQELLLLTPQIPSADTPIGKDESGNIEVRKIGEPTKFDFKPKDHIELGKNLNLLDLERGVKTGGFRGYYLKNEAALMHMGLMMHGLKKMIEKGFTAMIPPTLVRDFSLIGSGHFPFGKEEVYQVANPGKIDPEKESAEEGLYLVGTAEPSILAYRAGETIDESELPLKMAGFSQCYRSEVGSYGKDTKGIYRIHEFMKIEQVVFCKNDYEESTRWQEKMLEYAEEILRDLELPYRVLQLCTGDMGAGKYRMFDLETWMPSRDAYGETHSCSNLGDWQTRRLNIRVKGKDGEKYFPHALNNTVIASPRILIAIWENYQQADGSMRVPIVLQPYVGKEVITKR